MTKKERICALIDYYANGKPTKFAQFLGVAASTISSWLSRNTFDYDLIFAKCESISPEWLLTGKGNMLKSEKPQKSISIPVIHQETPEPTTSEEVQSLSLAQTRPRIPYRAAAGSLSIAINSVAEDDCERIPLIPTFPKYDFTIIAKGESMSPDIQSGDELACRFITESSFIQWGRPHVIDTAQGIVVKRLYDGGDNIICRSCNKEHDDFLVPKDEIYHIALVVGLLRQY